MNTYPIASEMQESTSGLGGNAPSAKRKKRIDKEEVAGTLLASLPLIGFLIFGFIPLVLAMAMAFMDIPRRDITEGTFAAFQNFEFVLNDPEFWKAVANTLILGTSTLISQVLSLGVAYLLSQPVRFKKGFRMIYFIPYVCSVIAVTLMWQYMFNTQYGIINQMIGTKVKWLEEAGLFRFAVIIMSVWSGMGYGIIMYMAALTGVNNSLIEAAKIDGAKPFRIFLSVVVPAISPTTFFLLVTGLIGALQSFAMTNTLSPDGTAAGGAGITIVFYLYKRIYARGMMGIASASAWILALMVLVITIIQFIGSKKWVHYD